MDAASLGDAGDAASAAAEAPSELPDEWLARRHLGRPAGVFECGETFHIAEPPLDAITCSALVREIPHGGLVMRIEKTVVFVLEGKKLRRALEVTNHVREQFSDPSRLLDLPLVIAKDGRTIDVGVDPACADLLAPDAEISPNLVPPNFKRIVRSVCENAGRYVFDRGSFRRER